MMKFSKYQAVFKDQPELLENHLDEISKEDEFGLSLFNVAYHLDQKKCLTFFGFHPTINPLIELQDFTWSDHLIFKNPKVFQKIVLRCQKAKSSGWIESGKIFKGTYYKEEIKTQKIPAISIRWIDERLGYGVFAEQDIPRFSFLGEYVGLVRRKSFYSFKKNLYLMRYPTLFINEREYVIDASKAGNHTRFINHSYNPNLEIESVFFSPFTRMIFFANKKILKGEQLTFDYGKKYWKFWNKPLRI